ncbi:hypothetical protein GN244_ATG03214 [Phytophthora infestans]|uniref:Uncharacterized protein n=1 Tax=Phytophthora infestans TaxID=4787 RepID=A0A833TDP6_PHYIN|nr:hypothetical protein GN244_ATG03214 [Phytophthora infestans]
MTVGRPKSSVWTLFSEASENGRVKGLRCSTEKSNPKAHKLESHFMHCQDYTLEERKKRKRTAIERKEKDIRKRRRQRGVQLDGEDVTGQPSQSVPFFQAHLDKLVADFVYESGIAFRIVELPISRCLITRGGVENADESDDELIEDGWLAWQSV